MRTRATQNWRNVSRLLLVCGGIGMVALSARAAADTAQTSANANAEADQRVVYSETREPCRNYHPQKTAFFGDLHTHTALSWDAWVGLARMTPADAYAFALGEPLALAPFDEAGRGTRVIQIDRPLDFASITDHAEMFGEAELCKQPDSGVYGSPMCAAYRGDNINDGRNRLLEQMGVFWPLLTDESPQRSTQVCGENGQRCRDAAKSVWSRIQQAAETYYDRSSDCRFTTFVGYEYSSMPQYSNLHRNVIYRNAIVTDLPITNVEEPSAPGLWRALDQHCLQAGTGCDVLAIPHNSNLSNGRMFMLDYPGADSVEQQAAQATLRQTIEPMVEMFQHKGDSECRNGLVGVFGTADELCDFEKFRPVAEPVADCGDGFGKGAMSDGVGDCGTHRDYARYALTEGLKEQARIGANPFKFGLMASQDTHNGNPGDVDETSFVGAMGLEEGVEALLGPAPLGAANGALAAFNPGGLVGIWAQENSRDALFNAMQRREVFGTSGPRIRPRLFAGWDMPPDLCKQPNWEKVAYRTGVPMGGDLPRKPAKSDTPVFYLAAEQDPGTSKQPGQKLQRLQIIKGWVNNKGQSQQAVYDLVAPDKEGFSSGCERWSDPDFDPTRHAVYYARVVELPSKRYSTYLCESLREQDRSAAACETDKVPQMIQERAWTSPIWYTAAVDGRAASADGE